MKMGRLDPIVWAFLLLVFPFVLSARNQEQAKPNVLLIVCDDLNDWVEGFGGHPQSMTPHMDRLRKKGVSFINAHSNNPICAPSRTSFLSGLHPHTTGYFGKNQQANHFRYIRCPSGEEELYDHRNDPHEWYNLAGNPQHEETLMKMRKRLFSQIK